MTKIEWTEKTWNPIVGCSVVSPGCTNCYAMKQAHRIKHLTEGRTDNPADTHYFGTTRVVNGKPVWTGKVAMAPEKTLLEPLRRRKPTMYFVNSMGDLFHEDVPDSWIDRVFAVMALCPQHTFQVLTKRSARMRAYLGYDGTCIPFGIRQQAEILTGADCGPLPISLPNVWLGVSAEDQTRADERIPNLLSTPAAVRFVSCEPLLGAVQLDDLCDGHKYIDALLGSWWHDDPGGCSKISRGHSHLDWVICGGESGKDARPMHPDWARSVRDQCTAADVPFFFKQWGEWTPGENVERQIGNVKTAKRFAGSWIVSKENLAWSEDHIDDQPDLYRVGKKRAGRILDGRTWDEVPS